MLNIHHNKEKELDINRLNLTDMEIYIVGSQKCKPKHSYGPAVREHFLIHYIYKGKGIFKINNRTYHLQAGQGFLIHPNIVTYYIADKKDPWTYAWIGFNGLKAKYYLEQANLNQKNPIFSTRKKSNSIEEIVDKMITSKNLKKTREIELLGLLYLFLAEMIKIRGNNKYNNIDMKEIYLKEAVEYIDKSYYNYKLNISEITKYIGVDRSYLWSIFKDYLNLSPQQFLINFRMDKACRLLKNKSLSIGDVSRSVGYQDPLTFSKTFKKIKGIPPSKYRKDLYNKQ